MLPRRDAVLAIAQEIEGLNNANLAAQRAEVTRQQTAFSNELYRLLWRTLLLGLLLAVPAVIRLRVIERRSEEQRERAQDAERQMRELSQQLVAAQEDERRKLSRELHDHVGQMLTALRLELGRIDRLRSAADVRLASAVAECRQLVDDMVESVRDLALGLRPSMLDDFGLQPALEWQARDFTRRCNVPVALSMTGALDTLTDQHRTCVYRVVQEALTNCVRHAQARAHQRRRRARDEFLDVSVSDDGVGLDPRRRARRVRAARDRGARPRARRHPCASRARPATAPRWRSACRSLTWRRRLRVLLADDHGIVRRGLRSLIETQPDFKVVAEAGDGLEALKLCDEHQPDTLILDIAMPKMNGIEVAERAQKLPQPPSVIILSMHADESYIIRALAPARARICSKTRPTRI